VPRWGRRHPPRQLAPRHPPSGGLSPGCSCDVLPLRTAPYAASTGLFSRQVMRARWRRARPCLRRLLASSFRLAARLRAGQQSRTARGAAQPHQHMPCLAKAGCCRQHTARSRPSAASM
jgi:hypothetical protein